MRYLCRSRLRRVDSEERRVGEGEYRSVFFYQNIKDEQPQTTSCIHLIIRFLAATSFRRCVVVREAGNERRRS